MEPLEQTFERMYWVLLQRLLQHLKHQWVP